MPKYLYQSFSPRGELLVSEFFEAKDKEAVIHTVFGKPEWQQIKKFYRMIFAQIGSSFVLESKQDTSKFIITPVDGK